MYSGEQRYSRRPSTFRGAPAFGWPRAASPSPSPSSPPRGASHEVRRCNSRRRRLRRRRRASRRTPAVRPLEELPSSSSVICATIGRSLTSRTPGSRSGSRGGRRRSPERTGRPPGREGLRLLAEETPGLVQRGGSPRLDPDPQRADRPGHVPAGRCLARDPRGLLVDGPQPVLEAVMPQLDAVRRKGVGLDDVGSGLHVGPVNLAHQGGIRQGQLVEGAIDEHAPVVELGAEPPVEDDERVLQKLQERPRRGGMAAVYTTERARAGKGEGSPLPAQCGTESIRYSRILMTTLRFCERPDRVPLSATGFVSPKEMEVMRCSGIPPVSFR